MAVHGSSYLPHQHPAILPCRGHQRAMAVELQRPDWALGNVRWRRDNAVDATTGRALMRDGSRMNDEGRRNYMTVLPGRNHMKKLSTFRGRMDAWLAISVAGICFHASTESCGRSGGQVQTRNIVLVMSSRERQVKARNAGRGRQSPSRAPLTSCPRIRCTRCMDRQLSLLLPLPCCCILTMGGPSCANSLSSGDRRPLRLLSFLELLWTRRQLPVCFPLDRSK